MGSFYSFDHQKRDSSTASSFSFARPVYQASMESLAVQPVQAEKKSCLGWNIADISLFPDSATPSSSKSGSLDLVGQQPFMRAIGPRPDVPSPAFHRFATQVVQRRERDGTWEQNMLPKTNTTGLPDTLKVGAEKFSGLFMDDVQVHYHSSKPAEVQALAYTQGTEIYVGPGQEQHLAHEAWHVVQQKQGRVRSTLQAQGVAINDDNELELEADVMGKKTVESQSQTKENRMINTLNFMPGPSHIIQLKPRKLEPNYQSILEGIAWSMGIDPEKVTFLQDNEAKENRADFASNGIILQTKLLEEGGDRLKFVAGHELAHLINKDHYRILTFTTVGAAALGFIAWGLGFGLGVIGPVALIGAGGSFFKSSQFVERSADMLSAKKLNAAKGGAEHMNDNIAINLDKRNDSYLGPLVYSEAGNCYIDLMHPPLTIRKEYLEELAKEQEKKL